MRTRFDHQRHVTAIVGLTAVALMATGATSAATSAAHPGQTGWYATQDACSSFDYDCSGSSEQESTTGVFYPGCACTGTCSPVPPIGVQKSDVTCGAVAPNYSCGGSCSPCTGTNSPWTQRCH